MGHVVENPQPRRDGLRVQAREKRADTKFLLPVNRFGSFGDCAGRADAGLLGGPSNRRPHRNAARQGLPTPAGTQPSLVAARCTGRQSRHAVSGPEYRMILAEKRAPEGARKNLRTTKAHIGHENPYCWILTCIEFSDLSIEILKSIFGTNENTQNIVSGKMCLVKLRKDMNIGKYCRVFILQKYFESRAWFADFCRSTDETAWLLPGAAHDGGGG
jgi:hypothetical protein